jgi:hypothetical protein
MEIMSDDLKQEKKQLAKRSRGSTVKSLDSCREWKDVFRKRLKCCWGILRIQRSWGS